MAKNINSKLIKLFLLSCANAAIMTAMAGEARADIEIHDILNHTPEYEALAPAQKLNIIKGIQAREDFGDLFDDLMPGERRLFNNEIIEVKKLQAVAPVLNGARERREARAAGVEVVDLIGNTAVETGRNEQEMALENRLQVLEILAKTEGTNAVSVNDKIKKAIHFNNIENLNTPLEQLKYITMAGGVDANDNLKVVNNYVEAPLTKEAFEHIYFSTNITDPTVRSADIAPDYYKPGQSDLLKKFKSVATPETKRKLLNQFENYVTQNLVELEANKSNIPTRQAIIKLADPARLVTYLEKMAELKTSYIDNGKKKVVNEEGKLLDEAGLKNYNKILKDAGLITKDLTGKKMQALIDNFNAFTMSDLALVLTKTVGEIKIDNERLVGLNNTMPPFRGTGARPVRNLNNLDAITDLNPELKLAGHDLKAKEEAAPVVRGPAPVIGRAVEEALVAPNTDEGTFHNEMYLVKNTKNPEKLEVRTLGAENDLGITIRTLLTLEERKVPHESLALFSEANPDKAQLIIKAKNIWNRLKNDDLIKQTSRQALTLNNKIANGTFFEELFNEEEHNAIGRLNYTFGKLPLDLQNHITAKSNEIKIKDELQGKKTIISRIDYIAKNENVLGANSLNNEIERIVDNFNSLKLSDILDIALNKENVRDNIALTTKANEVNIQVNNWINNNIVNLTVDDSLGNGKGKLDKADLTSLQNKAAPATLSKIYEIGVDTKAKLLKKVLADNAADLSKASKNITEKNIADVVQNNFNAKMKALTPGTKDFSKEQIVKFLNVISDAKIKAVLKEVKTAKAASAPVAAPIIVVAGGPPPPPPLPTRVIGYNGLGMDGLVRKMNILKPIENLFPKKPDADAGEVVYIAPTSELGKKYEDAVKVIAASDDKFKKELAIKTKGKEKLKALIVEEVFEKYTTKNADALDGDINQLAQAIKEGTNIEFIGPKREVESGIDQETRNLCVRMNQDAGLMQQLKTNNPRLAAIIEAAAVNEEEVATRLPESAAAQAVENGDVNYGGVVVVAPAAAPVAPVAPLVLPADPEEDPEEVAVPAALAINMEDVVVVPPPVEEAPQADAEIMIVRAIDRIVPVEGNIEDFDDEDDDEDFEDDDDDIIQEQTKLEISSSTTVVVNKSESKDSEDSFENLKQEEAKVAASIKEAEEARIAEAVRVEAAEVAEMQNAVKQDEEMIGAIYNPIHGIITQMSRNIISHRMFSSAAVAAGDEDEKVLDKGLWIAGTIGTNKQKGTSGYRGHASGGTIGFDVGSDNFKDLVGIAYTKLDSKFKSSGSRSNTTVDSHILALYGQKELPKNFMIQAMFAYNHNIVKSKINRLGTIAIGKYKNNNYNFETLLSYNHLMNGGITLTPNLGIRYGHSKDGSYQESDVGIQHLSIASKKQHLWSGILGTKVALAPQKIAEGLSITPALQASVENYFNNKSKKLNAKVKWKDREVNETIALLKQPKVGYNIGTSVLTEKGNISVTLEYNCHLQKKYQSHQGFVKLKVKL